MVLALAAPRARAEGGVGSAARRAATWLAQQSEALDIDSQQSFGPNGPPPGLTRSRHPIWKVPGLGPLARPLWLVKGRIEERRSGTLRSALEPLGIIFVHVPKNAGSSLSEALYGRPIGHHSMRFITSVLPRSFLDGALSFAILREPRLRFLSAFAYLKEMPTSTADIRFRDTYLAGIDDFEDLKLYDLLSVSSIHVLRGPNFFKSHSWRLERVRDAVRDDDRRHHAPAAR